MLELEKPDLVRWVEAKLAAVSEGVASEAEVPVRDVHTIAIQPLEDVLHPGWTEHFPLHATCVCAHARARPRTRVTLTSAMTARCRSRLKRRIAPPVVLANLAAAPTPGLPNGMILLQDFSRTPSVL